MARFTSPSFRKPFFPSRDMYAAAASARRAWLVQMLEVAASLLMCCSLVWRTMQKAFSLPSFVVVIPINLPGMLLARPMSLTAKIPM